MITRVIKLPLDPALEHMPAIRDYYSSDNYTNVIDSLLGPLDTIYTYFFRYPKLFSADLGTAFGQGPTIDFMAAHSEIAIPFTILITLIGIKNAIQECRKQKAVEEEKAKKYESTHKLVQGQLRKRLRPASNEYANSPTHQQKAEVRKLAFIASLNKTLREDGALSAKYQSVDIDSAGCLKFVMNEQSRAAKIENKLLAIASASWVTLGLSSFAYWITWIGVTVVTGKISPAGIGETGVVGFAVPWAVGALYPLLKIRNWWKYYSSRKSGENQDEINDIDPRRMVEAANDATLLVKRTIFTEQKARLLAELTATRSKLGIVDQPVPSNVSNTKKWSLGTDSQIRALLDGKKKRVAATLFESFVRTFVSCQFASWIISDFLKVALNISLNAAGYSIGFGALIMTVSAAYGIYEAHKKYKEIVAIEQLLRDQSESLDEAHRTKKENIASLKQQIGQLAAQHPDLALAHPDLVKLSNLSPKMAPIPTPVKRDDAVSSWGKLTTFFGGMTGGAMIARILTVPNTVSFLPFMALSFSNPVTIGIIIGVGILYGLFKIYQHKQSIKEQRANDLLMQRKDQIENLQLENELMDVELTLLETKKQHIAELVRRKPVEQGVLSYLWNAIPARHHQAEIHSSAYSTASQNAPSALAAVPGYHPQ